MTLRAVLVSLTVLGGLFSLGAAGVILARSVVSARQERAVKVMHRTFSKLIEEHDSAYA